MILCVGFRRRQWHPTPVLLPGKSHGRRSLVGYSPWGRWGSDTTERLHFHFSLSCIGDGNGNPLQCFCLENPRDGGAWWAAVYGVTQSRTRLKWLSLEKQNQKDVCEYIYRKRLIMKNWLTWFWRLACLHLQYDQFETRKIDGVDKGSVWRFLFQECWSSYSV